MSKYIMIFYKCIESVGPYYEDNDQVRIHFLARDDTVLRALIGRIDQSAFKTFYATEVQAA